MTRRRSSLSPLSTPAYEEKDVKVLRIGASEVAAIAGFHEWVDVRELFLDRLLYQDLEHVLHADADNLGLELEDRRQRSERLLAKAGDVELQTVRERAGNASAVATVRDAKALRDKAKLLLKKAEASKKLSKEEARELEDDLRHDINTQFGNRNEEVALRVYERRSGTEVMCSNDRYLVWPFPGARHGDGIPDAALDPPEELAKGWNKTRNRRLKHARFASQAAAQTVVAADPNPSFASAVARCLAELPVRAVLEGVIDRVLSIASATDVETVSATVDLSTNGRTGKGVGAKGVDLSLNKGIMSVPASNGNMENGNRRQLAPEVPWPEWRRGVSTAEGGGSSVDAPGGRWCGQPGMWFPESLTPRQRDAVRIAAAELGFSHDLVANKAVVVWEYSAARVAAATASIGLEATHSVRRTLALPSFASPGNDGQCMSILGDASAPSTPGQEQPLRDGPSAVVDPEAGKSAGRRVSEGETGERGSGSLRALDGYSNVDVMFKIAGRSSMEVSEAVSTKGEVTSMPHQTIIPSVSGAADIAEAAAEALMCPEIDSDVNQSEAGVEVVYAWGEGPASAVTTTSESASTQEPEESSFGDTLGMGLSTVANQTPSVWCREPHVGTPEAEKIVAELPVTRRASMMSDFSDGREGITSEEAGSAGEGKVGENAGVDDRKKACFVIVGAVDGVAEELTMVEEDADTWETRRVVVEVKNRMNKAMDPPPLYDQIQLVTYMLMIGVTAGDLVQFVKTQPRSKKRRDRNRGYSAEETGLDKTAGGTEAMVEEDVTISRVELDCRRYHHKRHWQETILPRLYAFARMVYRFRSDDLLRWRYLLATQEEQREMLVECCPYLADVIKQTLTRASPTVRDVVSLEQERAETIATCPSSETSSGTASRKQKRGHENGIGYDSVNSTESVESGSSAVSPVRKRGKGEEGVTLERVGVVSRACKGT